MPDDDRHRQQCFIAAEHASSIDPEKGISKDGRIRLFVRMMQQLADHGEARTLFDNVSNQTEDEALSRFKRWQYGQKPASPERYKDSLPGRKDKPPIHAERAYGIAIRAIDKGFSPRGRHAIGLSQEFCKWTAEEFLANLDDYDRWCSEQNTNE